MTARDDLVLYTTTSDSTLRVFLPVLDSPRTLQLHASLDLFSSFSLPTSVTPCQSTSNVFWLDRELINTTLKHILKSYSGTDDARTRVLRDIINEGWDLFLRVLDDGSIVLSSLAVSISAYPFRKQLDVPPQNIDRRPPTLLQQYTLQYLFHQSLPSNLDPPTHLYILPNPFDPTKLTLVTSPNPLRTYTLSLIEFFGSSVTSPTLSPKSGSAKRPRTSASTSSARSKSGSSVEQSTRNRTHHSGSTPFDTGPTGIELTAKGLNRVKYGDREIVRFVRTSEGHAVGVIRSGRTGEIWRLPETDEMAMDAEGRGRLVHAYDFEDTDFVVVLDRGKL